MARKRIDIAGIVKLFGGKHQIVSDYENLLRILITTKAVDKWIERDQINTQALLNLKTIAEKKNINFVIEDFIK